MDSQELANWIQIITGVAVVVGLALVMWELQQSQEIARAQLAADGWAEPMALSRAQLSEDFAVTRSKACLHPSDLTDAELLEMALYHETLLYLLQRRRGYEHIGDYGQSWDFAAEATIQVLLSTKSGRAYYAGRKNTLPTYIREVAEQLLKLDAFESCEIFWGPYFDQAKGKIFPRP